MQLSFDFVPSCPLIPFRRVLVDRSFMVEPAMFSIFDENEEEDMIPTRREPTFRDCAKIGVS